MTGFGSGKILTLGLGIRKINIHDRALKAEQLEKNSGFINLSHDTLSEQITPTKIIPDPCFAVPDPN
jgi:hypothetical protein